MTVLKGHPILKSLEARDSARNKKNVSSETLGAWTKFLAISRTIKAFWGKTIHQKFEIETPLSPF